MKLNLLLYTCFLLLVLPSFAQNKTEKISCSEKWWVIWHPFVAKKAYRITLEARKVTEEVKKDSVLVGSGNGYQIDAFRHAYWMATLTKEIGWRRARSLGRAHEKGNYRDYKKRRNEDGVIPDEISSEMDLHNNFIGIQIGKITVSENLKTVVIQSIIDGKCKVIKSDSKGNYLDCEGNTISPENLKGKWKNNKCLVNSNSI